MTDKSMTMADLLASQEEKFQTLTAGDTVEGKVISITKNGIWLDLGPKGGGLIVGPEIRDHAVLEEIEIGKMITASVLDPEFEDGNALLSLRKATKEKIWTRLIKMAESKEAIDLKPIDANKGGLLMEIEGIRGFLPVSQLATENYPRVSDKDEIQIRLSGLIGKAISVIVLDADEKENKLIFSEKEARKSETSEMINKFAIGDVVTGRVTGIVDFGVFINVGGVEGLIHISEIAWDRVDDPGKFVSLGDEVKAKIIGIDNDRFSLSLKRLTDDPWANEAKSFTVGQKIEGEVTRITPFGAFVRIGETIEALVHISELSEKHIKDPQEVVEVAKKYKFVILNIDQDNHKIALSLKAGQKKETLEKTEEKVKKIKKETEAEKPAETKADKAVKKTKTTKKETAKKSK